MKDRNQRPERIEKIPSQNPLLVRFVSPVRNLVYIFGENARNTMIGIAARTMEMRNPTIAFKK